MDLIPTSSFKKQLRKFSNKIKDQISEKLEIFMLDEFSPILNNHKLHGDLDDCRSINVNGDIRLVYQKADKDICYLLSIGTHSELYS